MGTYPRGTKEEKKKTKKKKKKENLGGIILTILRTHCMTRRSKCRRDSGETSSEMTEEKRPRRQRINLSGGPNRTHASPWRLENPNRGNWGGGEKRRFSKPTKQKGDGTLSA